MSGGDAARTVKVSILDTDYEVSCPPRQEGELLQSAAYLDRQMRGIRSRGRVLGLDRIAVMAALNISHELLLATGRVDEDGAAAGGDGAASRQLAAGRAGGDGDGAVPPAPGRGDPAASKGDPAPGSEPASPAPPDEADAPPPESVANLNRKIDQALSDLG